MEMSEHIEGVRRDGSLLAAAATAAGLDAPVPTCPEWCVRELVAHTGGVHRWAAAHLATPLAEEMDEAQSDLLMGSAPADAELVDWFVAGHAALLDTLTSVPRDVACWTFLAAPSPLAFWARRQAHETAIHRVDAENASGQVQEIDPDFAADGVDEMLSGLLPRRSGRFVADPPQSFRVTCSDTRDEWLATIGPEQITVTRSGGDADCAVSGPASALYLLLWNRRTADGLEVTGDASFLSRWRKSVRVRW